MENNMIPYNHSKKRCYFMIGLPGSGKSTFAKQMNGIAKLDNIYSTDQVLEDISKHYNITYNEVLKHAYNFAEYINDKKLKEKYINFPYFIWDQTNLTKKSRRKKLDTIPDTHEIFAIVCKISSLEKHKEILKNRTEKIIDFPSIVEPMIQRYEEPSWDEGFAQIWTIEDFKFNLPRIELRKNS